jgi:hypothetical protein
MQKIIDSLALYSFQIIAYAFWFSLLAYVLYFRKLSIYFDYMLCLMIGLYLGYALAYYSIKRVKK